MATDKHTMPCEVNPSATEMDSDLCIAAIPIRSIAPTSACAKEEAVSKSMKVKKKKSALKNSNQNASTKLKPKREKKKASGFKFGGVENLGQKVEKRNPAEAYDEANFDFSKVPPPVCTCTGVARGCYRCGTSGWQSSCCTRTISEYPLPMSSSKPGARLGGRKMSMGAYNKLLCRLSTEGVDLSHPVDLKDHWARLGTNKFVTIK